MHSRRRIAEIYEANGKSREQIAERFQISVSTLADSINNSRFAERFPDKVARCKNPDEVGEVRRLYNRAKGQKDLEELERLQGILKPRPAYEIVTQDFNRWPETYGGPPFDFVNADFSWGIGQDSFNQSSRTTGRYPDTPEIFDRLCGTLGVCTDRGIIAARAGMLFWCPASIDRMARDRDMLIRMGWEVRKRPVILIKNRGILPRPDLDPRQCYETALVCTRGGFEIESKRDWAEGDPPKNRIHQSQKNEDALEHFFRMFVNERSRVLDPTCGSGVAIRVAKKLKVEYALGLEIDEEFAFLARAALEAEK
jgi:hypothetical protein